MDAEEKQYEENKKLLDEIQEQMLYTDNTSTHFIKKVIEYEKKINRKELHPNQQYYDIDVF